jgi:hypothetical protein
MVAELFEKFLALQGTGRFIKWQLVGHSLGKKSGVALERNLRWSRVQVDEEQKDLGRD